MAMAMALAASGLSAAAGTANYIFTVEWRSGALAGTTSRGSLSFDESLALPGAQYLGPNLLSSFSFGVGPRAYGLPDITTGFLSFDTDSNLRLLGVGTHCAPNSCQVTDDPASFYLVYDSQSRPDRLSAVTGPRDATQSIGAGSLLLAPVPEPSSLAILLSGLGVLTLWGRRRNFSEARRTL